MIIFFTFEVKIYCMRTCLLATLLLLSFQNFAQAPYRTEGFTSGSWNVFNDMTTSRNGHTTTVLADGRVLSTGGYDGTQNTATAEIYDPLADVWTLTGSMDSVRFSHTATLLNNGKVLIAGGWDGGFVNYKSTLLFDPATGEFTHGPDMRFGRSGHTATKLKDGRVLLVGGYSNEDGNTDVVEIYDPTLNILTEVDNLHKGRSYHTAALFENGKVLVAGGYNPDYGFQMASTEIYDPTAGTWTEVGDLHAARDYAASTFIEHMNAVYILGGRYFNGFGYEGTTSVEKFMQDGDSWTEVEAMPAPQSYFQVFPFSYFEYDVSIPCMLVPGGTNASGFGVDLTYSSSYAYNFIYEIWEEIPMFFHERYYYAADQFPDEKVIVTGGEGAGVEIFEPSVFLNINTIAETSISIHPNPVENEIGLTIPQMNTVNAVVIYNMNGEAVITIPQIKTADKLITIDVNNLPAGNYVVSAIGNNNIITGNFIKL